MKNGTIYITKTPRREPNALSKSRVWAVFQNDDELVSFMKEENLMVYHDDGIFTPITDITLLDKAVLTYFGQREDGEQIYLPHVFMMCRESRKEKPTFVKNAIRKYKLDLLLDENKGDSIQ